MERQTRRGGYGRKLGSIAGRENELGVEGGTILNRQCDLILGQLQVKKVLGLCRSHFMIGEIRRGRKVKGTGKMLNTAKDIQELS